MRLLMLFVFPCVGAGRYEAKFNAEKLAAAVRAAASAAGAVGGGGNAVPAKKAVHFRVASEADNDRLTGFKVRGGLL